MTRAVACLVLCSVLGLAGCGSDESPPPVEVTWVVDGNTITCPRASDTSSFQSGNYQSFTCIWYCASYKGATSRYVDLTFEWTGLTWVKASEYVSSGICY